MVYQYFDAVKYQIFSRSSLFSLQYLASKQPDLATECFVFKNYGRCNRGVTCRFAESHIVRDESNCVRNKVDKELADKFGSLKVRELNHLEKELQVDLRKKKYNFDDSDKKVDAFFKMRESEAKNGATTDPPPQKKIKIVEAGITTTEKVHVDQTQISKTTFDHELPPSPKMSPTHYRYF